MTGARYLHLCRRRLAIAIADTDAVASCHGPLSPSMLPSLMMLDEHPLYLQQPRKATEITEMHAYCYQLN